MQFVRRLIAAAAILLAVGVALPAQAVPSNTRIDEVFRLPCAEDVCSTSNSDKKLSFASSVTGSVQLQVTSQSSFGLEWARIDARRDDGQWFCIKQWDLNTNNFSGVFNWNTTEWPGDCPDGLQQPTRNGTYDLRVVAKERVSGDQAVSSMFAVNVGNRPQPPAWAGDLSVSGAEQREPLVAVRFAANPEADIFEYHYVRLSPRGDEREWAVSATKPGGQGCDLDGSTYICFDDEFATSGFGGTYTYALIAYRTSPSGTDSCALSPKPTCVQSSVSETRSITIDEPVEEPVADDPTVGPGTSGPTSGPGGTSVRNNSFGRGGSVGGGSTSEPYCWTCGSYEKTLPYSDQQYEVAREGSGPNVLSASLPGEELVGDDSAQLWRSVAAGLLLLLASAHAARVLRRA